MLEKLYTIQKETIIKAILITGALLFALVAFAPTQHVFANSHCGGLTGPALGACLTDPNPPGDAEGDLYGAIQTAIDIFSVVVGVIAVIMIIIGGLKYIMSSGDPSNITSAKNTILYAVIGLAIVALAQVIVLFVIDTV